MTDRDWRAIFNDVFDAPRSVVGSRIFREVLGDEYPEVLDPHSYITWSQLGRFASELHLAPGDTLADVGCGRGGPGLWVAAQAGAHLVGIDIADAAVAAGRARAAALHADAEFRQGTFDATGLPEASADAVMSVDALLFAPSKAAALAELRRILRAGGRLVFTSWDYHEQPVGRPPQVDDHRPLLAAAGFDVRVYETVRDWRSVLERIGDATLAAVAEIALEEGVPVDEVRRDVEEVNATLATMSRRVFVVAEAC